MTRAFWFVLALAAATASVYGQPGPGTGSGSNVGSGVGVGSSLGSGSGTDGEPTFEPAHVTASVPPPAPAANVRDQPLILDALHIGSSERIELFMFGDASAIAQSMEKPAFALGVLGLQVTAHLAEGLVGRTEIVLEPHDMMMGTNIDMSRMYLEYRRAGWSITGGSTHSELGYWNNAFHHGRWLQLTIARPQVIEFEDHGGMLPIHHVGVTVAHAPERGQGMDFALSVGNGHGPTLMDVQGLHDDNLAKSVLVRVGFIAGMLRFGGNIGFDTMHSQPATIRPLLPDAVMHELITGLYVALRGDPLVLYSEVYDVRHTGGNKAWNIIDGFVLVGYRIDRLIPYVQGEARMGDGATDPFYNPDPTYQPDMMAPMDFTSVIVGAHYDLSTWSALKLELEGRETMMGDAEYRVELNWSFGR